MFCLLLRRCESSRRLTQVPARGQARGATTPPKGLRDELRVEKPSVGALPEEELAGEKRGTRAENASSICFRKEEVDESRCRCQPFLHENSANHRGSLLDLKKQMPHHSPTT
jgi:hypothetical protein